MRALLLLFGMALCADVSAAPAYDFTPVTQQIEALRDGQLRPVETSEGIEDGRLKGLAGHRIAGLARVMEGILSGRPHQGDPAASPGRRPRQREQARPTRRPKRPPRPYE